MGYLALYLMFWNCLPVHHDFEYVTSLKKKKKKSYLGVGDSGTKMKTCVILFEVIRRRSMVSFI